MAFAQATRNPLTQTTSVSMVQLEGGTFLMGNAGSAFGDSNELPLHSVYVAPFAISRTEITQTAFQSVMGYNPSHNRGARKPVEKVSWFDAVRFCNALSAREELQLAYRIDPFLGYTIDAGTNGYRLPTEAEWEYAARGGVGTDTYKGNVTALEGRDRVLDEIAWYRSAESADVTTHNVGMKRPNAFGLYDMIGNVFEWTDSRLAAYPGRQLPLETPGLAEAGTLKVLRGGAIDTAAQYSRAAYRYHLHPSYTSYNIGFRVTRSISH